MWHVVLIAALLHPNTSPKPGEIGAFYFDVMNQSQVWVDLDARVLEDGPNPVRLNLTVTFPGHVLASAPKRVTLRATSDGSAFPLRIRMPVLRFHLHDATVIDLTKPESIYRFYASCEKCASDTLITDMTFSDLQTVAASAMVEADVLGFRMRLRPTDLTAIRALVAAVSEGVTVADR